MDKLTDEQAETIKQNFVNLMKPEIARMLKREPEKAPTLSSRGLQFQASFNADMINKLLPLLESKTAEDVVQEVISALRKRNQDLVFADSNPDGFKLLEKANAISAVTGGNAASDPMSVMLLAQVFGAPEAKKRKRSPSPSSSAASREPFRSRGTLERQSVSRDRQVEELRREIAELRGNRGMAGPRSINRCFNCHNPGHISTNCPQRR